MIIRRDPASSLTRRSLARRLVPAIPEIAFALATTVIGVWAGGRWLDPTGDPGLWWSLASRIAEGERYFRDLHLQYGPLSPLLLAWSGKPFGFSSGFFLLVNWIPAIFAGVLLLRLARYWLTVPERCVLAVLLVAVSVLGPGRAKLVFPYCPAAVHGLIFAVAALLLMGRRDEKPPGPALAAGLLAGLAFAAKQEIGVAALVALWVPLLTRARGAVRWTVSTGVGFAVAAGASLLYALSRAPLVSLAEESHFWPLAPTLPAPWRRLSRVAAGMGGTDWPVVLAETAGALLLYAGMFALAGLLFVRERERRRWMTPALLLAALLIAEVVRGFPLYRGSAPASLAFTMAGLLSLAGLLSPRLPHRDLLVGVGLFAGLVSLRSVFSGDLGGPYSGVAHFATALTACVLLFRIVPEILPGGPGARPVRLAWVALVLFWSLATLSLGLWDLRSAWRVAVPTNRGTVWMDSRQAALFHAVRSEASAGERVFFVPETHGLDVLYDLKDASPFLIHVPGWLDASAERKLLTSFERRPPDLVVRSERGTSEFGVRPFGQGYGILLSEWISRRYQVVAAVPEAELLRPARARPSALLQDEGRLAGQPSHGR